jgi:hypothetical protein
MSNERFEDEKVCSRCSSIVPNGLVACPYCAMTASNMDMVGLVSLKLMAKQNAFARDVSEAVREVHPETRNKRAKRIPSGDLLADVPGVFIK